MKKIKINHEEMLKPALGNIGALTASAFFFLTGISAGIFLELFMNTIPKNDIAQSLMQYLGPAASGMAYPNPFFSSLLGNLCLLLILFAAGISVYGFPAAFLVLLYKGFTLGFSCCLVIETLSVKGAVMVMTSILPQNLLIVPALVFAAAGSVNYALMQIKKKRSVKYHQKRNPKREISPGSYSRFFLLPAAVVLLGCLIEAILFPFVVSP